MNLNMFDNIEGLVIRERDSSGSSGGNGMNGTSARFPKYTSLAMAYVPFQPWGDVYNDDDALKRGTLFPALDLPFEAGGVRR